MKLYIHGCSIEQVDGAYVVQSGGQEIGYYNSLNEAAAFVVLHVLSQKPRSQLKQIRIVAKALDILLKIQIPSRRTIHKRERKIST